MKKKIEMIHELQRTVEQMAETNATMVKTMADMNRESAKLLARVRRMEAAFSRMGKQLPPLDS